MDIKFQFLYKGAPFHGGTGEFNWHKKVYSLDQLISTRLSNLCDVHNTSTLVAKRQFTGLKDKNGVDIYDGDIIRVRNNNHGLLVEFINDYVGGWVLSHPASKGYISLGARDRLSIEVIGNIYQNSELIENNNQ